MDGLWRKRALSHINILPGMRILDIGAGTGKLTFEVAERLDSIGEVVGLDPCDAMLENAQNKLERFSSLCDSSDLAIRFVKGKGEELPFDSETFDVVVTSFAVRNMTDMRKGLHEVFRVLVSGGNLMILDMCRPPSNLFGSLYRWYLRNIIGLIATLCLGERESSSYLESSILQFLIPEELCDVLREKGFTEIHYYPIFFDIIGAYIGKKPFL